MNVWISIYFTYSIFPSSWDRIISLISLDHTYILAHIYHNSLHSNYMRYCINIITGLDKIHLWNTACLCYYQTRLWIIWNYDLIRNYITIWLVRLTKLNPQLRISSYFSVLATCASRIILLPFQILARNKFRTYLSFQYEEFIWE